MNAKTLTAKLMPFPILMCVSSCAPKELALNVNFKNDNEGQRQYYCALSDFIDMDEADIDQISEKLARSIAKHNETYLKSCTKEAS